MSEPIGSNPLPFELQQAIVDLIDRAAASHEIPQGQTAMFWALSFEVARHLGEPLK